MRFHRCIDGPVGQGHQSWPPPRSHTRPSELARQRPAGSPQVQYAELLGRIREAIDYFEAAFEEWGVETEPVARAVRDTAEPVTGERVFRRSATGGGGAKALRDAGFPTMEFAPETDTINADDEFTTVEILRGIAESYTRLPQPLATAVGA